jgi:predicted RNA-binding Zn ribbon-like protein
MGRPAEYVFDLSGGRLCLDFANTASQRRTEPQERLRSYADLVAWARQTGLVDRTDAQALLREAARRPAEAEAVLEHARALRETLFLLFSATAAGGTPPGDAVAALNAALPAALAHRRLASGANGLAWEWERAGGALDSPLWPVVHSAAELLASDERRALRECAAGTCAWLFLDHSRNHSRRWCDMKVCGNRVKARRHYERARQRPAQPPTPKAS